VDRTERTSHVVIVAGGESRTPISAPDGSTVIAADSGFDHAIEAGLTVDLLIGDLDSISAEGRRTAEVSGVEVVTHPRDKDATDLELAMSAALERDPTGIDVYGGEGGTLGHLLAGAMALTSDRLAGVDVRWHIASGVVVVARPGHPATVSGEAGNRVTIVPVGDVMGVRTDGLRWGLEGEALVRGSTRGVSNELDSDRATVRIDSGVAFVVAERA
jgi:thiamine pyrophosphokinase